MTQQITDKLNEMRERRKRANGGPWGHSMGRVRTDLGMSEFHEYKITYPPDAIFVVEAANNWMTLITCLEKAVTALEEYKYQDPGRMVDPVIAKETLTEIENLLSGGKG